MIRAVLDANVLVSALLNPRGVPARVLELWRADAFKVICCESLAAEFEQVMTRPQLLRRGVSPDELEALACSFRRSSVMTPETITVLGVSRDRDDNKVLACALEGKADYIVTGDDDLLALGEYEGIVILSPTAFLAALAIAAPEETL